MEDHRDAPASGAPAGSAASKMIALLSQPVPGAGAPAPIATPHRRARAALQRLRSRDEGTFSFPPRQGSGPAEEADARARFDAADAAIEKACDGGDEPEWERTMAGTAAFALTRPMPALAAAQLLALRFVPVELLGPGSIRALFEPIRDDAIERSDDPAAILPFDSARSLRSEGLDEIDHWETVWARVEAAALGRELPPASD